MKFWNKKTQAEISDVVFGGTKKNINYAESPLLGIPASYLDPKVFNQDASFLEYSPYLNVLMKNPNHIGCHTMGNSESFFNGTQEIERDVINICAVDILKAAPNSTDGYIASGGTEANIQAIWIYRNYFKAEFGAKNSEITILCSSNSHYSMAKGANLLEIGIKSIKTDIELDEQQIDNAIKEAKADGKKYFIVVCNMMTTMFGSVDNVDFYTDSLKQNDCIFKIHIDGAYGGFYYPFSNEKNALNLSNPHIDSVTLDAHKMAQAPYGTGIFIIRKGLIQYANTKEASYVEGEDCTLIGSRSGANAVAVWMILSKYGPFEWSEKIFILQKRTDWLCNALDNKGIEYYRNKFSNIVTINSLQLNKDIVQKFGLVPDNHMNPKWHKIVVMDHVTIEKLESFINNI